MYSTGFEPPKWTIFVSKLTQKQEKINGIRINCRLLEGEGGLIIETCFGRILKPFSIGKLFQKVPKQFDETKVFGIKCGKMFLYVVICSKTKNLKDFKERNFNQGQKASIISCQNGPKSMIKPKQFQDIIQKGFSAFILKETPEAFWI